MYKTKQVWGHLVMKLLLQLPEIPKNKGNKSLNPNKAGLFEGSFSWEGDGGGVNLTPPSYFKKDLSRLYTIVKQSI